MLLCFYPIAVSSNDRFLLNRSATCHRPLADHSRSATMAGKEASEVAEALKAQGNNLVREKNYAGAAKR